MELYKYMLTFKKARMVAMVVNETNLSSKIVKAVDEFIDSLKDWSDLSLNIHESYQKLKELAVDEGLTEQILKDYLNAKVKPLLSKHKYYKLLGALFKSDKPALDDKTKDDDDDDDNEDTAITKNADEVEFPHRLLNRLSNIIEERKGNGFTATFLKIENGIVKSILEE